MNLLSFCYIDVLLSGNIWGNKSKQWLLICRYRIHRVVNDIFCLGEFIDKAKERKIRKC